MIGTFVIVVVILGFEFLKMFIQWWDSISPGTPRKVYCRLVIVSGIIFIVAKILGIEW